MEATTLNMRVCNSGREIEADGDAIGGGAAVGAGATGGAKAGGAGMGIATGGGAITATGRLNAGAAGTAIGVAGKADKAGTPPSMLARLAKEVSADRKNAACDSAIDRWKAA